MNILIIDNSRAFTGAFKCALNEATLLSSDHKFSFVLHDKSNLVKPLEEKGFNVHKLYMVEIKRSIPVLLIYPLILLRNAIELRQIVRRERIDVIQVNDFYNLLGAMVKILGYKGKLITYVRFLPSVMPGPLRKLWIKLGVKYSHKVVAVSDAVLKQLPQAPNVIRIYDPVQLTEELPAKKPQDNKTVSILYLSNYIKGKGQDMAVEAFAKAYNQNNSIRLTFMGGDMGLEKNAEFRKALEKRVRELKLNNAVTFAAFNADVEKAIKDADIVLNFSEAESFSMTCLETAFYGTALIATKCGGPEEIIDNEKTGLLVPVNDIEAMGNAIVKLANDEQLRNTFALAGREYVRSKFDIELYKDSFTQMLNER